MACNELDGQVARREDKAVAALLDRFVCVRLVRMWGVDLSRFQFDGMLTWATFFTNADGTIYGRYGSRGSKDGGSKDVSLAGFKAALEGALELHRGYPANRKELAGRSGPRSPWATPEVMPAFAGQYKRHDITQRGCIHCHNVDQGRIQSAWMEKKGVPDSLLWSYPMPNVIGLTLDVQEKATVKAVRSSSAAEKAGFKVADRILRLEGQPILSIADVQWVLHNAPDTATLNAEVDRAGKMVALPLALAEGWRRQSDFTWRGAIVYQIRPGFTGQRAANGVRVNERLFGGKINLAAKAGLNVGDIILAVADHPVRTEAELIAAIYQKTEPGKKFAVMILRGDDKQTLTVQLP